MKTDLYTKTMLTIIAFSLIVLCSRDLNWPASAKAQDAPAKPRGPIQVQVVNPSSSPVNMKIVDCGDDFNEYLPITIMEVDEDVTELPVAINKIGNNFEGNQLPVISN